jgi:hypothetical protein
LNLTVGSGGPPYVAEVDGSNREEVWVCVERGGRIDGNSNGCAFEFVESCELLMFWPNKFVHVVLPYVVAVIGCSAGVVSSPVRMEDKGTWVNANVEAFAFTAMSSPHLC